MDKRIITGIVLLIGLCLGVLFVYFQQDAPENILAVNRLKRAGDVGECDAILVFRNIPPLISNAASNTMVEGSSFQSILC